MQLEVVIGMDWADEEHAVCLMIVEENRKEMSSVKQSPEAIAEWVAALRTRFPHHEITVCLEQTRGALIYCLMTYEFLRLVPINPKQLARFREAFESSGAKDDPGDAELLAELFAKHGDRLRVWQPNDEQTRLLRLLNEDRRHLVDQRTAYGNQLKSLLKQYFPQAQQLFSSVLSPLACALLERWPSLQDLQRVDPEDIRQFYQAHGSHKHLQQRLEVIRQAKPLTEDRAILESRTLLVRSVVRQIVSLNDAIHAYDQKIAAVFGRHQDREIFAAFPGAGHAMAPRLCAAFGTDRTRYAGPQEVQSMSGIAPVTKKSGKSTVVHRRWACNKFLRQTFHEFAAHSIKFSPWAKAYYQMMKDRTASHHAAVRALAFKWIRILYRCWKERTIYNELHYYTALQRRKSPLLQYLNTEKQIAPG